MAYSNLDSFLKCATPAVRTQFLPKWESLPGSGRIDYFVLEDLWDCYDEWSAYGVGAPIRLNSHETVVQYYTPYLSALQIYTGKSPDPRFSPKISFFSMEISKVTNWVSSGGGWCNLRTGIEELFLESETESMSSDNEEGRLSRTNSNSSNRMWDSDDSGTDQDVELKIKKPLGKLYCQYFDHSSPHQRLPFRDMIKKLAEEYPGLNSLRSIDISPASWMAVAWYPIYHLPSQRNPKELYSAFLTYHSLSSPSFEEGASVESLKMREASGATCLPPFGLATYRMQRRVWVKPGTEDPQKLSSLWSAAASWLKQVDAIHPDFSFFVSRSM